MTLKQVKTVPLPPLKEQPVGFSVRRDPGFAAGAGVNAVLIVLAVAMAIVLREVFHHH